MAKRRTLPREQHSQVKKWIGKDKLAQLREQIDDNWNVVMQDGNIARIVEANGPLTDRAGFVLDLLIQWLADKLTGGSDPSNRLAAVTSIHFTDLELVILPYEEGTAYVEGTGEPRAWACSGITRIIGRAEFKKKTGHPLHQVIWTRHIGRTFYQYGSN